MAIHSTSSRNWKAAVEESNRYQMKRDTTKVNNDVHNATPRAFLATTASSPRMVRMKTAPTRGRNVTRDRMGNVLMTRARSNTM